MTQDGTRASDIASRTAEAFWNALGLHGTCAKLEYWTTLQELTSALRIQGVKPSRRWEGLKDVDDFIKLNPSLEPSSSPESCADCKRAQELSILLKERFYKDLSPQLRQFTSMCSLQKFSRPAGSFRFERVAFPGDVDIEEYIIVPTKEDPIVLDPRKKALQVLSEDLRKLCHKMRESNETMYWGGLKAGHGIDGKTLTWTQEMWGMFSKCAVSRAQTFPSNLCFCVCILYHSAGKD